MRTALITGVAGQDGSYLAELLLSKGYRVHGTLRQSSTSSTWRIDHLANQGQFELHYADLGDAASLRDVVRRVRPDELYNLASQSHVRVSFEEPERTVECNGVGCLRLLEILRTEGLTSTRFFQAASSEIFGQARESPQNERTPLRPRSPYASAKAFAYHITQNYREAYGMFAANGILFNHESPRRGENFVTRKVTRAAARIRLGLQKELKLGNLEGRRDWGHAKDYAEAMWLTLQAEQADDFVIASGKAHSVRDLLSEAFGYLGLTWEDYVQHDARELRPNEVDAVVGDTSRAREVLGWEPRRTFAELVREMVDHDLAEAQRELA